MGKYDALMSYSVPETTAVKKDYSALMAYAAPGEVSKPEEKEQTYLGRIGEVVKDIPETVGEAFGRTKERAARIFEPTELGKLAPESVSEGVLSAPERVTRTVLGTAGTAGELIGVPVETAMKGINALLGGKPGDLIKSAVSKGVGSKTGKKVINAASKWWGGLDESAKANYGSLPDVLDMIGLKVGKTATSTVKQVVKKEPGFAKQVLSKYSEIPTEALEKATDKETLKAVGQAFGKTEGDLHQTGKQLGEEVLKKRRGVDESIIDIEQLKKQELEKDLYRGKNYTDLSKSGPGLQLKNESVIAKKKAGERFESGQSAVFEEKQAGKISTAYKRNKNILQNEVDDFLKKIQYSNKKGFGKAGNRVIPADAISAVKDLRKQFGQAKTLEDALFMRRLVDQKINFGRDGKRMFERGSDSDWTLHEIRNRLNSAIEKKIKESPNGEEIVGLWRENNKKYSVVSGALSDIEKALSMGKTSSESYIKKIQNVGIDKLQEISKIKDEVVKPVWEEVKKGFYDDIILNSVDKNGIDYKAFTKKWSAIDPKLKSIMLPASDIKKINSVITKYSPEKLKPSTFGSEVLGKTIDPDRTARTLENIGSKSYREDLQQLRFIDDILGNKGDGRVSDLAEKVYLGKQLKMTPEGKLPAVSGIRTGKSLAGMAVGSSVGGTAGAAMAGPFGAAVGTLAGILWGMYIQSPSAALTAYKILNKTGALKKETTAVLKGVAKKELGVLRPGSITKGIIRGIEDEQSNKP